MMRMDKYYDCRRDIPLTACQGCPLDQWQRDPGAYAYAFHPKGFLVFLPPDRLAAMDEFRTGDPYGALRNRQSRGEIHRHRVTLELVAQALAGATATARILDVGCGEGAITADLRRALPSAEISALDASLSAIEKAVDLCPGTDFVVADAYEPPYQPEYFDVVVCNNIWEHMPDPLRLLAGVARVLKPDGCLVISTPNRFRLANILRLLVGRSVAFASPRHVTEYTVGQAKEQLRFGGFELTRFYGRPVLLFGPGAGRFLVFGLLLPVIDVVLRLLRSPHTVASTVFYLARKRGSRARQGPST